MDVFISDVHLGTKDCRCDILDKWLKKNHKKIDNIYLVGDDLIDTIKKCLTIDRNECRMSVLDYSWKTSTDMFLDGLVDKL